MHMSASIASDPESLSDSVESDTEEGISEHDISIINCQ